jgi:hypothetical protein
MGKQARDFHSFIINVQQSPLFDFDRTSEIFSDAANEFIRINKVEDEEEIGRIKKISSVFNDLHRRLGSNGRDFDTVSSFLQTQNPITPVGKTENEKLGSIDKQTERLKQNALDSEFFTSFNDIDHFVDRIAFQEKRKVTGSDTGRISDLTFRFGNAIVSRPIRALGDFLNSDAVRESADSIQLFLNENPEHDGKFFSDLASGAGDITASIGVFAATSIAFGGNPIAGTGAAFAYNSALGFSENYREVFNATGDENLAIDAGVNALPAAAVETLSDRLIGSKLIKGKLFDDLASAGSLAERRRVVSQMFKSKANRRTLASATMSALSEMSSEVAGDILRGYGSLDAVEGVELPTDERERLFPTLPELGRTAAISAILGGAAGGIGGAIESSRITSALKQIEGRANLIQKALDENRPGDAIRLAQEAKIDLTQEEIDESLRRGIQQTQQQRRTQDAQAQPIPQAGGQQGAAVVAGGAPPIGQQQGAATQQRGRAIPEGAKRPDDQDLTGRVPAPGEPGAGALTPEAEALLSSGGVPAFISENLRKIATENGIEITPSMTPNNVIDALRNKKASIPVGRVARALTPEAEKLINDFEDGQIGDQVTPIIRQIAQDNNVDVSSNDTVGNVVRKLQALEQPQVQAQPNIGLQAEQVAEGVAPLSREELAERIRSRPELKGLNIQERNQLIQRLTEESGKLIDADIDRLSREVLDRHQIIPENVDDEIERTQEQINQLKPEQVDEREALLDKLSDLTLLSSLSPERLEQLRSQREPSRQEISNRVREIADERARIGSGITREQVSQFRNELMDLRTKLFPGGFPKTPTETAEQTQREIDDLSDQFSNALANHLPEATPADFQRAVAATSRGLDSPIQRLPELPPSRIRTTRPRPEPTLPNPVIQQIQEEFSDKSPSFIRRMINAIRDFFSSIGRFLRDITPRGEAGALDIGGRGALPGDQPEDTIIATGNGLELPDETLSKIFKDFRKVGIYTKFIEDFNSLFRRSSIEPEFSTEKIKSLTAERNKGRLPLREDLDQSLTGQAEVQVIKNDPELNKLYNLSFSDESRPPAFEIFNKAREKTTDIREAKNELKKERDKALRNFGDLVNRFINPPNYSGNLAKQAALAFAREDFHKMYQALDLLNDFVEEYGKASIDGQKKLLAEDTGINPERFWELVEVLKTNRNVSIRELHPNSIIPSDQSLGLPGGSVKGPIPKENQDHLTKLPKDTGKWAKVRFQDKSGAKTIYLKNYKIENGLLSGTQVNREGDEISGKGFDQRLRIIGMDQVKWHKPQSMNLTFGELEDSKTSREQGSPEDTEAARNKIISALESAPKEIQDHLTKGSAESESNKTVFRGRNPDFPVDPELLESVYKGRIRPYIMYAEKRSVAESFGPEVEETKLDITGFWDFRNPSHVNDAVGAIQQFATPKLRELLRIRSQAAFDDDIANDPNDASRIRRWIASEDYGFQETPGVAELLGRLGYSGFVAKERGSITYGSFDLKRREQGSTVIFGEIADAIIAGAKTAGELVSRLAAKGIDLTKQAAQAILDYINKIGAFLGDQRGTLDIGGRGALPGATERGEIGVNKQQLVRLLGASMYNKPILQVSVKELLQNAFDAVKARKTGGSKNITVDVNYDTRIITVSDDGVGMSKETVKDAFLTIGGTEKAGLTEGERSGGKGLAKIQFLLGSKSVHVSTVKNGVETLIDATAQELYDDNFDIRTNNTDKPNGTTVSIEIPESYTSLEGNKVNIHLSGNNFASGIDAYSFIDILSKPLIGDVSVLFSVTIDGEADNVVLPLGNKQPKSDNLVFVTSESEESKYKKGDIVEADDFFNENDRLVNNGLESIESERIISPQLFSRASFNWGNADIYIGENKQPRPQHYILSSGLYQFDRRFFLKSDIIPFDVVVDIKPSVDAVNDLYPFNNQREGFKPTVFADIEALDFFIQKFASGQAMKETISVFKDIKALPKTDPNTILTPEERKKIFASVSDIEQSNREILSGPRIVSDINIFGSKVFNVSSNEEIIDVKKEKTKRISSFRSDKDIDLEQAKDITGLDQSSPQFHNNTNVNYLSTPGADVFFSDLGSVVLDFVRYVGKNIPGYGKLTGDEDPVFAGISIDKTYGGIHIRRIFNAIFINPLAFDPSSKEEAVGISLHSMIHEINHTLVSGEGADFTTNLAKLYGKIYSGGQYGFFEGLVRSVYSKHFETFQQLKQQYDKTSTRNTSQSFEGSQIQGGSFGSVSGNEEIIPGGESSTVRNPGDRQDIGEDKIGDIALSNLNNIGETAAPLPEAQPEQVIPFQRGKGPLGAGLPTFSDLGQTFLALDHDIGLTEDGMPWSEFHEKTSEILDAYKDDPGVEIYFQLAEFLDKNKSVSDTLTFKFDDGDNATYWGIDNTIAFPKKDFFQHIDIVNHEIAHALSVRFIDNELARALGNKKLPADFYTGGEYIKFLRDYTKDPKSNPDLKRLIDLYLQAAKETNVLPFLEGSKLGERVRFEVSGIIAIPIDPRNPQISKITYNSLNPENKRVIDYFTTGASRRNINLDLNELRARSAIVGNELHLPETASRTKTQQFIGGAAGGLGSEEASKLVKNKIPYGFGNIKEFISEAISNKLFATMLDDIPSGRISVFSKIKQILKKILGFSQEDDSLLDEVLFTSERIFREEVRGPGARTVGGPSNLLRGPPEQAPPTQPQNAETQQTVNITTFDSFGVLNETKELNAEEAKKELERRINFLDVLLNCINV